MNKKLTIYLVGFIVLAAGGALVFYFYKNSKNNPNPLPANSDFIETTVQAPPVEGNIVNSGIAGKVILISGEPFEASLEIFEKNNPSKPFISIRTHSDGTFQVPLRPGAYILKPFDPDGPAAPIQNSYSFVIGNSQWLQVSIKYK
jgi:hypothetical protein